MTSRPSSWRRGLRRSSSSRPRLGSRRVGSSSGEVTPSRARGFRHRLSAAVDTGRDGAGDRAAGREGGWVADVADALIHPWATAGAAATHVVDGVDRPRAGGRAVRVAGAGTATASVTGADRCGAHTSRGIDVRGGGVVGE